MAGGINKRDVAGIIGNYDGDKPQVRLCPDCLKPLQERVYAPDPITKKPVTPPRDHDSWLQCHHCFRVYAKYQSKVESEVNEFVEPISNPHDSGGYVTGLDNKKPKSKRDKDRERFKKELDAIGDKDERRDRKKIGIIHLINSAMD